MQISAITVLLSILSLTAAIATPQADSSVVQLKPRANPVPDCSLNGGKALCCQGTFAGDIPLIVALAGLAQFSLNPNDINCIGSGSRRASCLESSI
jgi:hypothetical protein